MSALPPCTVLGETQAAGAQSRRTHDPRRSEAKPSVLCQLSDPGAECVLPHSIRPRVPLATLPGLASEPLLLLVGRMVGSPSTPIQNATFLLPSFCF